MFNPNKCPLFQWRLSFGMKLMYSSGVWSYVVGAITTPTFILIPLITIWIGVFPIIITRRFTLAATIYAVAIQLLQYQVKKAWCAATPPELPALHSKPVPTCTRCLCAALLWCSSIIV